MNIRLKVAIHINNYYISIYALYLAILYSEEKAKFIRMYISYNMLALQKQGCYSFRNNLYIRLLSYLSINYTLLTNYTQTLFSIHLLSVSQFDYF